MNYIKQHKVPWRGLAIVLLVLVTVMTIVLGYKTVWAGDQTRREEAMQVQIDDFNQKAALVNQESFRPVKSEQVGFVQQDIMTLVQQYGLNVLSLKRVRIDDTGETYQLDLNGSWAGTANFLESFQAKDALLGMRWLSFEMVNGSVQTIVQYKIYTKG